jgi:hypothetical protein
MRAAVVLALLLGLAAPARAGGPGQPPDGAYSSYRVAYFLGRTFQNAGFGTIVTCTNVGSSDVRVLYQVWDQGTDPSRAPLFEETFLVPAGSANESGSDGDPDLAVGRISLSDPRAAVFCSALLQNLDTDEFTSVPLLRVGKPPKLSIK